MISINILKIVWHICTTSTFYGIQNFKVRIVKFLWLCWNFLFHKKHWHLQKNSMFVKFKSKIDISNKGSTINDDTDLRGGHGFCDDMWRWEGCQKNIKNFVTSFMNDPKVVKMDSRSIATAGLVIWPYFSSNSKIPFDLDTCFKAPPSNRKNKVQDQT